MPSEDGGKEREACEVCDYSLLVGLLILFFIFLRVEEKWCGMVGKSGNI